MHEQYGGVFPEIASRAHVDAMLPTIEAALQGEHPDLIAVSQGPGLMGPLLMGLTTAKSLSLAWGIPYVGVNHVEAHLYAAMMHEAPTFPALGLVVSGGHTFLARIDDEQTYTVIASTVDDAVGEAFDKVASMLGLPYPGGPAIERLAKEGDPHAYPFRAGRVKGDRLAFSFSGLKTNVLYTTREIDLEKERANIAASFQHAALSDIATKTLSAAKNGETIYVGGGVSQSRYLRTLFGDHPVIFPRESALCLDNGAMIAGLGYHRFKRHGGSPLDLTPFTRHFSKK
jgi:N6-L-threonylcarbamoyladenine synthase